MLGLLLFAAFWLLSVALVGAIFIWPAIAVLLLPIAGVAAIVFAVRAAVRTPRSE